jgi:hypothetical protein
MDDSFDIPVVLLVFNRPNVTEELVRKLEFIRPSKLYVVADGPRESRQDELELCLKTRQVIENGISWKCEIHKKYSEYNLGCGISVSSGLNWVFEHEEYAIILEDDCIPAISFFSFCKELLIKFRYDTRVMHICGSRWNEERIRPEISYFFSKYSHVWGWATWHRAWTLFDYNLTTWPIVKKEKYLYSVFESQRVIDYYTKIFDTYYNKSLKPGWATQWFYSVIVNSGMAIVPNSNLINNKGNIGTHSTNLSYYYNRPADENYKIISHPKIMILDRWFDTYHSKKHILRKSNLYQRIYKLLVKKVFDKGFSQNV